MVIGLLFGSLGVVGSATIEILAQEAWRVGVGRSVPWPLAKDSARRACSLDRSITRLPPIHHRIIRLIQSSDGSVTPSTDSSIFRQTARSFVRSPDRFLVRSHARSQVACICNFEDHGNRATSKCALQPWGTLPALSPGEKFFFVYVLLFLDKTRT